MEYDSRDVLLGGDADSDALVIAFAGAVDDVRVYRRAFTVAEVAPQAPAEARPANCICQGHACADPRR